MAVLIAVEQHDTAAVEPCRDGLVFVTVLKTGDLELVIEFGLEPCGLQRGDVYAAQLLVFEPF